MEHPIDAADAAVGIETFGQLSAGVERCIRAGRLDEADPVELAMQLWAMEHGIVTLFLAGLLTNEQTLATFTSAALNLLTSFGDDRRATGRSMATALRRLDADRHGDTTKVS
jgi:hypothetical protein